MKITAFTFEHSELSKLTADENVALFQLAHIHNELTLSQKHLLWVWNRDGEGVGPDLDARIFAFTSSIARFAGQLREAYKAIDRVYYGSTLSRDYHSQLSTRSQEALVSLKRYFSSRSVVMDIRDRLAFHHDIDLLKQTLSAFDPSEEHAFYFGEGAGNTFFGFAHHATAITLIGLSRESDVDRALIRLAEEVVGSVADWTFHFISDIISLVLQKTSGRKSEIMLNGVQSDDKISVPFFSYPKTA
ncbi:hypothetical protein [Horticoccus sp. 23ND18S-11]|uniref:hypothetical protein n=1 Tax=Horticoccus sp. 23ND18S-11 TaxID=3391832 RepID=UPI0039C963E9